MALTYLEASYSDFIPYQLQTCYTNFLNQPFDETYTDASRHEYLFPFKVVIQGEQSPLTWTEHKVGEWRNEQNLSLPHHLFKIEKIESCYAGDFCCHYFVVFTLLFSLNIMSMCQANRLRLKLMRLPKDEVMFETH